MAAPRTPPPPAPRAGDRDRLLTLLRPHRGLFRTCGLDLPDPGAPGPVPVDRLAAVLAVLGAGAHPDLVAARGLLDDFPAGHSPADPGFEGNNLDRFWQAVDALPDGAASPAEWRRRVGPAVDLVRPFLRPRSAPVGDAGRAGDEPHEYEVDRGRLAVEVAAALGADPAAPTDRVGEGVRWVGRVTADGARPGCFLAFPSAAADAHVLAARLIAAGHAPFVLLPPTRRWVRRPVGSILRRAGCRLVPLDAAVCAVRPGQLWPLIPVAVVVGRPGRPTDPIPPGAGGIGSAALRPVGDGWWVTFAGQAAVVRDELGVRYLAHLLRAKGRAVPAVVLRAEAREQPAGRPFPGVEVADPKAAAAYRAARDALTGELEAARMAGDVARLENVQDRLDRVTAELRAADGFGDRPRRVGDEGDRARTAVKNALDRAIGRIGKRLPALARHLAASIRTGRSVCYDPDPDVDWVV